MAEAITSAVPDKLAEYWNSMRADLNAQAPKITYNEQPESKLRASIMATLQPSLTQALRDRQNQTQTSRAAIDADATARGMGSSTWVTDAKSRLSSKESSDMAAIMGNYGATLAQQLANRTAAERAAKLQADQYNAGQEATVNQQALGMGWNLYNQWLAEQPTTGSGGSGSSGSGSGTGALPAMSDVYMALTSASNQAKNAGVETYAGQGKNLAAQNLVATQAGLAQAAAANGANNPYAHWRPKR